MNEADSQKIIHGAFELAVNFFDTAMVYSQGASEQFLGRAIKILTARDKVIVTTKFHPPTAEESAAGGSHEF